MHLMHKVLLGFVLMLATTGCSRMALTDGPRESSSHVQPIEGANRASVRIESGGGNLSVGALDETQDTLSTMSYEGPPAMRPQSSYQVRDGVGELEYIIGDTERRQTQSADLRVQLARGVPLALKVESGATQSTLDLTRLQLIHLDLQAGASDIRVRLPDAAGLTAVKVESGAAKLTFDLPLDVAADIEVSGALVTRSIDEARFRPLGGGRYRSTDYETAANRVEMHLELGAANLTVR
jgi:hypothetical protein